MSRKQHQWTPQEDEQLRQMRIDGWTAKMMAAELGVTRCSVLGRTHRLGLPLPQNRILKHRAQRVAWHGNASLTKRGPSALPPVPLDQCEPVLMEDLTGGTCRYPISDEPPFSFCAMPVKLACYCERHYFITHQPPKNREEIAA